MRYILDELQADGLLQRLPARPPGRPSPVPAGDREKFSSYLTSPVAWPRKCRKTDSVSTILRRELCNFALTVRLAGLRFFISHGNSGNNFSKRKGNPEGGVRKAVSSARRSGLAAELGVAMSARRTFPALIAAVFALLFFGLGNYLGARQSAEQRHPARRAARRSRPAAGSVRPEAPVPPAISRAGAIAMMDDAAARR